MRIIVAAGLLLTLAVDLPPETLKAFERYTAVTEQRMAAERDGRAPSLWIDRQPERDRAAAWVRLRRGEVVVSALETRDGGRKIDVKNGLVHHWVATVWLPGVRVERLVTLVRDYEAYPKVFAPLMTRAAVVRRGDNQDVVALRTSVKKGVSVIMDADYVMDYGRPAPGRVVSTNVATNLHQVHNAGQAGERREPADQSSGYLWRYRLYCTFEERPEGTPGGTPLGTPGGTPLGTIDQCEALTLTRDVPWIVSWAVSGLVKGIPRDSLEQMLASARAALVK